MPPRLTGRNDVNEGVLHRDGTAIHYWDEGADHAPTVVLTHGATLDHGAFAEQVPVLTAAGYRCITWDMRGHGASQPLPGNRFSLEQATEDLHALLDRAGVRHTVLIGQSFGGFVVQRVAAESPQSVVAMVLIGTPPFDREPIAAALPPRDRMLNRSRPALLRIWPERHLRRILPAAMSTDPTVRRYVAQATSPMTKPAMEAVTRAALEGLTCRGQPPTVPTLTTYGEREPNRWTVDLIHERATRHNSLLAHAVPHAGHLANQDNPPAFNAALTEFLHQHAPAAGVTDSGLQT
jgi:3-oxoadipate enol-lactonase